MQSSRTDEEIDFECKMQETFEEQLKQEYFESLSEYRNGAM